MKDNTVILGSVDSPLAVFSSSAKTIRNLEFTKSVDVVGAELSIDVLTPIVDYPYNVDSAEVVGGLDFGYIKSSDGYIMCTDRAYYDLRLLPYGTLVSYYRDDALIVKAYVKNVVRTGQTTYRINAVSAIGLLETQKHYGGMYTATTFAAVLADIIGGAVPYTVEPDVANIAVYGGYLPYATKRANLHSLLFAYGVSVRRNAAGDMHFAYLVNNDPTAIPDSRIYIGGDVDYSALASEVQVTEHSFMALGSDETVVEYDNTDGSETANHAFIAFRNAPLHDLTASGTLTIEESGVNYAIISGTGVLSGKKYTHSTRVLTQEAEDSEGRETNVVSTSDCTLVTVLNSVNVAARLLAFYASKKTVRSSIVLDGESAGDFVTAYDPYYETIGGFIATMQVTVSAINKADATIVTDYVPVGGNNFTQALLYTGSGQLDFEDLLEQHPEKENDLVQAVLIGGGHGGYRGANGTRGQRDSNTPNGPPGDGGDGGNGGEGGRVLAVSFHVSELASAVLQYQTGAGGLAGSDGGDTLLGAWTSADGATAPYGVANIFTGDIYALPGSQGVRGGDGGNVNRYGASVTYGGQTWSGGKNGGLNYQDYGGAGGGGAAYGANGNNAGYFKGGNGAAATPLPDATGYGEGGSGGNGGGGGGVAGYDGSGDIWTSDNGAGGAGSVGSRGGPGLLIILI